MISEAGMKKRTKKTIQVACKVFLRLLLAVFMCAILHISISVLSNGLLSDNVGYRIYQQDEDEEVELIEEHYYADGEDILTADDLDLKENQLFTAIREVPETAETVMNILSQILLLVLLGVFPYNTMWQFGSRDDTNVRYRGQKPDPWRGVKIGAIANIPYALLWVLLFFTKLGLLPGGYLQLYRLLAFPFFPYVSWLFGSASVAADFGYGKILALIPTLLVVPAVCGVAYRLGGNQFSINEFLTFAKKKDEATNDGEI